MGKQGKTAPEGQVGVVARMVVRSQPGKRESMIHLNEAATLGLSKFARSANLLAMRQSSDSWREPIGIAFALDGVEGPGKDWAGGGAGAGRSSASHSRTVGTCWHRGICRVTHAGSGRLGKTRGAKDPGGPVGLRVKEPVSCNALVVPRGWPLKRHPSADG